MLVLLLKWRDRSCDERMEFRLFNTPEELIRDLTLSLALCENSSSKIIEHVALTGEVIDLRSATDGQSTQRAGSDVPASSP